MDYKLRATSTRTLIFWVIFKTLPFLNEMTDFDAVWTIIELNLWDFG